MKMFQISFLTICIKNQTYVVSHLQLCETSLQQMKTGVSIDHQWIELGLLSQCGSLCMEQYAGIHAISTKLHSEPAPRLNHFISSWSKTFWCTSQMHWICFSCTILSSHRWSNMLVWFTLMWKDGNLVWDWINLQKDICNHDKYILDVLHSCVLLFCCVLKYHQQLNVSTTTHRHAIPSSLSKIHLHCVF